MIAVVKKSVDIDKEIDNKENRRRRREKWKASEAYNTKTVSYNHIMEVKTPIKSIIIP